MITKNLGLRTYPSVLEEMRTFTDQRKPDTEDEIWLLEHYPIYTQGQAGKQEHILNLTHIPIFQSDRGGQVTYHGPGQLIAYVLFDIQRKNIGIRDFVYQLEQVIITTLDLLHIESQRICGAPGVYVQNKKIASIGLRVRCGKTYHGIALNVDMDLNPFKNINPCGYQGLEMTQIRDYIEEISLEEVQNILHQQLNHFLGTTR